MYVQSTCSMVIDTPPTSRVGVSLFRRYFSVIVVNKMNLPSFAAGYVMSYSTMKCIYKESLKLPFLHISDVFVTGFCAEACGIAPLSDRMVQYVVVHSVVHNESMKNISPAFCVLEIYWQGSAQIKAWQEVHQHTLYEFIPQAFLLDEVAKGSATKTCTERSAAPDTMKDFVFKKSHFKILSERSYGEWFVRLRMYT